MKQPGTARKPYNGPKKALAIALDVGTTFSGVSYAVLDPGEIPKIYEVTRYAPRVPSPPHFPVTLSDVLRPFRVPLLLPSLGVETRVLTLSRSIGFPDKNTRREVLRSPPLFGMIDTAILLKLVQRRRNNPSSTRPKNRNGLRSNCTFFNPSRYPMGRSPPCA